MGTVSYEAGASLPDLQLWHKDASGTLIDFSSGYTFVVKVGPVAGAALFTKSSGTTGAVGSGDGTGAADVPNVTIAWLPADLGALAAGSYELSIAATRVADSKVRKWHHTVVVERTVT